MYCVMCRLATLTAMDSGEAEPTITPGADGLPDGVRAALLYGANLVFFEFAHEAVTDPVALAGSR